LNIQEDSNVTHEYHATGVFMINEYSPHSVILFCLIDTLARESKIVGDISHFWLKYINIIEAFEGDKRFICLKRDKEKTIQSYLKYDVPDDNPLFKATYDELSVYYDDYYVQCEYHQKKNPKNFRIFDVEALNSEEGQRDILNFLGYENHIYEVGIKLNQGIDTRLEEGGIEVEGLLIESQDEETGVLSDALQGERAHGAKGTPPPEAPPLLIDLVREEMKRGPVYGHFC